MLSLSWDNIIIGKGNKGCSAEHVFEIKGEHSISHNSVSFWINDRIFGFGMTIFKDTIEGQKLENMIKSKVKPERIFIWLDKLVIKKINHDILMERIKEIKEESYEAGKAARSAEIFALLNH